MSIQLTGGYAVSANNFAWPASGKLCMLALIKPGTLTTAGNGHIIAGDQANFSTKDQKFQLRIIYFDVAQYYLSLSIEDNTGAIHHYDTVDLLADITGPQVVGFYIDVSSGTFPATCQMMMNKTQYVAPDNLGGGGSVNSNSNKVAIAANNIGEHTFDGTIDWLQLRNAWIGDAAYNSVCDSASSGTFANPLQYLPGNVIDHWRGVAVGGAMVNAIGHNNATLTGSYSSSSSFLTGVQDMGSCSLTLAKDASIGLNVATSNFGAETYTNLRANVAGTIARRIVQHWTGMSQIPAGATSIVATLTMQCGTVTTASAQQINCRRLTQSFTEGTGTEASPTTDGVCWTNRDGVPNAWSTAGGTPGTANENIGTSPVATGSFQYDVSDVVNEQYALGGDDLYDMIKRATESGTLSNVDFDSRTGSVPPTLNVTWTDPSSYPARLSTDRLSTDRLSSDRLSLDRL